MKWRAHSELVWNDKIEKALIDDDDDDGDDDDSYNSFIHLVLLNQAKTKLFHQ